MPIVLSNRSRFEKQTFVPFHGLRFSGADRQYGTSDDYVTEPPTLGPGEEGTVVIRFDSPGEYEFRHENLVPSVKPVVGKVIVP